MASNSSNFLVSEAQLVLDETRRQKAETTKALGSPIELFGKALCIEVRGSHAWIAENTAVARKLDLESGKTLQLYQGHRGPVTTIAFCDKIPESDDGSILITGSWDQTIKLWDTDTKALLSSTAEAHGDFVKSLFVIPSLQILVSSGSDKIVRFWDIATPMQKKPLCSLGSISSHTRPVECLTGSATSSTTATLYTADTMGIIKCWALEKENGLSPRVKYTLQREYNHHRTRINEIRVGDGQLWTASSDETVQLLPIGTPQFNASLHISHPAAVRSILPLALTDLAEPYLITGAGDVLRVYDLTSPDEPELVRVVDGHWHDVTAIRFWKRRTLESDGTARVEPWIISTSLDSTIRKWRLTELLVPSKVRDANSWTNSDGVTSATSPPGKFDMSEEEERELAELLDD